MGLTSEWSGSARQQAPGTGAYAEAEWLEAWRRTSELPAVGFTDSRLDGPVAVGRQVSLATSASCAGRAGRGAHAAGADAVLP